jgi:hypothetical protein
MGSERLEALLGGDAPRTLEEKQRADLLAELRAESLTAPEALHRRVLEAGLGSRRRRSLPRSRRGRALVVVLAAAALAVGAAVVHGVVSSGSHPRGAAGMGATLNDLPQSLSGAAATTNTPLYRAPAPKKKVERLLAPAHQAATQAAKPKAVYSTANGEALLIPHNRLVHADASLEVQVPNRSALSRATNKATQIVASLGGYAQSVHYESSHHGSGDAVLALRVPVQKAQAAITKLGGLGTLLSQQLSTKDLQQQLTHQTNGIGSLRRAIAVYEQALQSGTLSAPQRVEIQIRLANARHSVTQLRKARTGTIQSGATADVSLTLTTRSHAVVVTHHRSGRFGRLLRGAAGFLGLEGIIVLYALVVVSPLLVLGGLAWAFLRERRRRDERRLLASA